MMVYYLLFSETKTVAEQVNDESTEDWVERLRKTQREKEIAEERVCHTVFKDSCMINEI